MNITVIIELDSYEDLKSLREKLKKEKVEDKIEEDTTPYFYMNQN